MSFAVLSSQCPFALSVLTALTPRPAFKRLDAETVTFRLSIPREYNSSQPHVSGDTRLCVVYAIPHVCTILLHEPFCTMADGDVSFTRCMVSAKAILESIYSLWSASRRPFRGTD